VQFQSGIGAYYYVGHHEGWHIYDRAEAGLPPGVELEPAHLRTLAESHVGTTISGSHKTMFHFYLIRDPR